MLSRKGFLFGLASVVLSGAAATASANDILIPNLQAGASWQQQGNGSWVQTNQGQQEAVGPNGEVYSDTTTFSGSAFAQGPTASTPAITRLVADDLTFDPASTVGADIRQITFSVANLNAASISFRPRLRFYMPDGAGGDPGTVFASGFSFNPITIAANTVSLFFFDPGAGAVQIPAGRKLWAAETFDNAGTSTATAAQMANVGQGLYNPPTVGSSADRAYETNTGGSFFQNLTATDGADFTFNGNPIANFGWEFRVAVPEPTTMGVLGVAGLGLLARRRRA